MIEHAKDCDAYYVQGGGYSATPHHRIVMQSMPNFREHGVTKILDVGCGRGLLVTELTACGFEVTGTEICPSLLEGDLKKLPVFPYSVGQLGTFVDGSFDIVMGVSLLSSLRGDDEIQNFLGHASRIASKGLLITETAFPEWVTEILGIDPVERRDKTSSPPVVRRIYWWEL